MRRPTALSFTLLLVAGACVVAPSTTAPAPAPVPIETAVTEARLAFISIRGELPDLGAEALPPPLLDSLMENTPVLLDLTLNPPLEVALEGADGTYESLTDCQFGPVKANSISVPTGSHHMLLDVHLGDPDTYAANMLSCEYDPAIATDASLGTKARVRGCFLPQSVSIPTAIQWVLNPLPATACGIGD